MLNNQRLRMGFPSQILRIRRPFLFSRRIFPLLAAGLCLAGQLTAANQSRPPDLKSNVGWWSADDKAENATVVDVSVPEDLTLWTDQHKAFTIAGGQPGPAGESDAFLVFENEGADFRWLAITPEGYAPGPCKISFSYKSVGGASVWISDGSQFYPEFEFTADGVGRVGNNPYAVSDNAWFSVRPTNDGFFQVDLWLEGANIQKHLALSTISQAAPRPLGDVSKGIVISGLTFSQCLVTELRDLSSQGANLSGESAHAPFFQKSDERAGLLPGGSCWWQPDGRPKFLSTENEVLRQAFGDGFSSTVMALVRRQWFRGEGSAPAPFFQAVAESGAGYALGFTPGHGGIDGNHYFAGVPGESGAVSKVRSDTEWNVVAVVRTGNEASIFLVDHDGAKLVAGPAPVEPGTISAIQVGADRSAVRELAVWKEALDARTLQDQAAGMVARAGGQQALNTFRMFDGLVTETRTKSAPYHWRDDSGTAFFDGAVWILGGAIETTKLANDVWKSTDYGATWTEVEQTQPYTLSGGAAAFPLTIDGQSYLYQVACYGPKRVIHRSTDGSNWEVVCDDPPWRDNQGQAVGVLGGDIYAMGGQVNGRDPKTTVNSVYKSSDGGFTWEQLEDAPWAPRTAFGPLLSTWKGKLWVVHGGAFEGFGGGAADRHGDVWSFDGKKWECVLEQTPWPATYWSTNFVLDDELYILGGKDGTAADRRLLWRTKDGVNWQACFPIPWGIAHESCATQTDKGVLLAPTDWDQTTRLLRREP